MATSSITPIGTTAAAATAAAAAQKLRDISNQIKELSKRPKSSDAVQEYRKDTRDVLFDNNATARDIGRLVQNKTRLNVISALSKNDDADAFRFRIAKTAPTKIGTLNTQAGGNSLRYQIFSRTTAQLIADSDPRSGAAYKSYQELESGTLEMKAGEYVLRISRLPRIDTRRAAEFQYAVQFSQGSFTQDYDTVEKAYRQGTDDPFGLSNAAAPSLANLMSSLSSSSAFIAALPPIGTDATSKLTGALYDALF